MTTGGSGLRMDALQPGDPGSVGGYRLLGRLGAGGMGQVYLGVSPSGRRIAVKLIHPIHAGRRRSVSGSRAGATPRGGGGASGRPPFGGEPAATVMFRIVAEPPDLAGLADEGLR